MRKSKKIFNYIILIVLIIFVGGGLFFGRLYISDDEFINQVDGSGIYYNSSDNKISQTKIYDIIHDHFFDNPSEKPPKLLFVGYDGCLVNVVPHHEGYEKSAIFRVAEKGGLYLGYTGGETPGDQNTDTGPGWATTFTGLWDDSHEVSTNRDILNEDTRSIIYELGENGIDTSFSVIWEPHFTVTYSKEKREAQNKNLPIEYVLSSDDDGTYQDMLQRIENGDTIAIFGIFEHTDKTGHTTGFSASSNRYINAFRESEDLTYNLLDAVEERDAFKEEDWLIIIMTDHGGRYLFHGGDSPMERMIFYSFNKPLFHQ